VARPGALLAGTARATGENERVARICVFCSSSERIAPEYRELASRVGTAIAARGHDLVSGGGRVSMMGAVAAAVRAGGRHTLGVIPEALVAMEVADTEADELVVTADMRERKGRMDAAADAFLTLPGGLGTLEELFEVWTARSLGMHAKPIVILDPFGVYEPLQRLMDHLLTEGFARPAAMSAVTFTTSVEDALDHLEEHAVPLVPDAEEVLESEI
jgi:uncharacterized protein (TIGR00730 family)